jgi:hypothetical protein
MPKFVKLPVSKIIIDLETIAWTGQTGLNEHHIFFKHPTAAMPKIEGKDLEALEKALGVEALPEPLIQA